MEIKNVKFSKFKDQELITAKNEIDTFIKFLDGEYKNIKKLEEENQ
jgi:hypothetical protein